MRNIRKLFTLAVLAVVSGSALFAAGCASEQTGERPYSLTGRSQPAANDVEHNKAAARGDYSWKYRNPSQQ